MPYHYSNILVPLDGSQLSEAALPYAFSLASLAGGRITLITAVDIRHVIEPAGHESSIIEEAVDAWRIPSGVTPYHERNTIFIDEEWERERLDVKKYLKTVSERFGVEGVEVQLAVEFGSPVETILSYARAHPADLIVMTTHGRTGLKRMVYGSVAEVLLRDSHLPILLVRAPLVSQEVTP
ncbi:MAG: universal stress protein [Geobacteraceae bacterium]